MSVDEARLLSNAILRKKQLILALERGADRGMIGKLRPELERLERRLRNTRSALEQIRPKRDSEKSEDEELLTELARVIYERDLALAVVKRAGFPMNILPEFSMPLTFWSKVLETSRNGALGDGVDAIGRAAATVFFKNPVFARYCS